MQVFNLWFSTRLTIAGEPKRQVYIHSHTEKEAETSHRELLDLDRMGSKSS